MKKPKKATQRDVEIYAWKVLGKGISWARWCHMNGIKVHQKAPRGAVDAPRKRPDAQKAKSCNQPVLP